MSEPTYGHTKTGEPITAEMIEELADEAERGYSPGQLPGHRRGPGRPPLGEAAKAVEYGSNPRYSRNSRASRKRGRHRLRSDPASPARIPTRRVANPSPELSAEVPHRRRDTAWARDRRTHWPANNHAPRSPTGRLPELAGSLLRRAQRLLREWIELHHTELAANWERAGHDEPLQTVAPLP